jgi:hypothetical protein
LTDALAKASGRLQNAHASRKVLVLFSGGYTRTDGIQAYLATLGLEAVMVDNDAKIGGNARVEGSYILKLLRNVSMSRAAAYGLEGPGVSPGSTPSGSGAVYTHTHTHTHTHMHMSTLLQMQYRAH